MVVRPEETGDGGDRQRADIYEARIIGSFEQLDTLLRSTELDVGCSHPHFHRIDSETASLLVFSTLPQVEQLRDKGHVVELGENVSRRTEGLKNEIGAGDRFDGGRVVPRGFGVKTAGRGRKWRY
jgi:hypothetical protein